MSVIQSDAIVGSLRRTWQVNVRPTSGTAGTLANAAETGDLLLDTTYGVLFVNEGSKASPYWTPLGYDQAPLFGVVTDFRDQAGKAVADTNAEAIIAGSGLRVFGQGIAETDSGLVAQAAGEGGIWARATTTNEAAHLVALGTDPGVMQPDTHLLLVIDVELTMVSAITNRALFCGFLGTAADALDPPVSIAGTTATLVQDDMAGLCMDAAAGDADRLYGVHNKSDGAATQDLTADGDTSTNLAAAATSQRFRVEINSDGDMVCFVDKAQVYQNDDSLDVDEEVAPVLTLISNTTSALSMDVKRFAAWAYRA